MKKIILQLIITISVFTSSFGQSIWTNSITDSNPSASNPFTAGQVVSANLTVSGIGRGTGITANAGSNRYNAANWATAFDANDYFTFTLTPASGFQINFVSLVYSGQSSGTGPTTFMLRSSLDNYVSNIGSSSVSSTISLAASTYQNITVPITFRLYGFGASAGTGTYSVNDFTFNGAIVPAVPMGLNLKSFTATSSDKSSQLNWITTDEINFSHFEIQRSFDGKIFISIGIVECGSSSRSEKNYSFDDKTPDERNNYYRLKIIDLDQTYSYSKVISLAGNKQDLKVNFNISTQKLSIPGIDTNIECMIYGFNGNCVLKLNSTAGTIDLQELAPGAYVAVIKNGNSIINKKFTKI